MVELFASVRTLIQRHSPYPPAVQVVALSALLATPFSAVEAATTMPAAFQLLCLLVGVYAVALLFVPARRMPLWAQLLYLLAQCAVTVYMGTLLPVPLLDYTFLAIVLQAITLFRPWLWIPFAVLVLAIWNGLVLSATSSIWTWLQSNLVLAFPATCVIIAAIIYTRQIRRNEQVQQSLLQMQQHYDSLAAFLREQQQHIMLEERRRLAQTIADEMQSALVRAEQSVTQAISQTQSNFARLRSSVEQTRLNASGAIERLRNSISTLRRNDLPNSPQATPIFAGFSGITDDTLISSLAVRVLTWVLPLVFISLSLGLITLQHHLSASMIGAVLLFGSLLLFASVFTQMVQNPLLLQAGLVGQTLAVLMMALITQTLPLLLGLLLVLWQAAIRLSPGQALMFLLGAPTSLGVFLTNMRPNLINLGQMLPYVVASVAVTVPLLLARRQQSRRRQAELHLALLSAEITQQTSEVHQLAISTERNRLAREFHDDLGSRLMLINLHLQLAEELADERAEEALARLQSSRELLHAAWRSVIASADADLPLRDVSLPDALHELLTQAKHLSNAQIDFSYEGTDELPLEVTSTIFRTVQEGLANAQKHAHSSSITIRIINESGYVTVTIDNDDQAETVSSHSPSAPGSFGLIGLRERADMLGGGIEAGPRPDGGWRLRLVLPAELPITETSC